MEPFLTSAVLPEFDAPDSAPYLRAHACWAYSQYADSIEFENEALLGTAAVKIVEVGARGRRGRGGYVV